MKLDGTPTQFIYYVEGTEYSITSDVTITNLTAAPSTNNTCLVNDGNAADQYWTKYTGEDGTEIPVDNMGSEISALVGKFAGFKLNNGSTDEYFIAYVKSTTALAKVRRGAFFDSTDAAIPRIFYTDNDTITLMKLTWVFAKTDGTLTVTYNNPTWSDDEPTSPAANDYWFDFGANKWKKYDVAAFVDADAILVGVCMQNTTATVAARSFEFFAAYEDTNTVELFADSNSTVKSRFPGSTISVWGHTHTNYYNLHLWDMTLDLDSGVTESASTYYYFYITEDGDKIISDKKPHDRRVDLQGYYHPHQSWRCVGRAFNNASSNLTEVESYYRSLSSDYQRSVIATDIVQPLDKLNILSGASFTSYLPPAALNKGRIFEFYHNGTSLSQVYTLDGFGSETIDGATTYALYTNGEFLRIVSDGSNWLAVEHRSATPWASYTPAFTGLGTPTGVSIFWRRQGDTVHVNGKFVVGTTTAAFASIGLPGASTVDTTKTNGTLQDNLGFWYSNINTTATATPASTRGPWWVSFYATTTATGVVIGQDVDLDGVVSGSYFLGQNANAFSQPVDTDPLVIMFSVPVLGCRA